MGRAAGTQKDDDPEQRQRDSGARQFLGGQRKLQFRSRLEQTVRFFRELAS